MALWSGDDLGKKLTAMTARCLKCGEGITFDKGAQLAMDNGIHDKVLMCGKCRSIFEVYITPGGMSLRGDVTDRYTSTPQDPGAQLAQAIRKKDLPTVKQLIRAGAPLNGRIGDYNTALWYAWELACNKGDQELVRLLLARGGSFNDRDVNRTSPLTVALLAGQLEMVKFLLEQGASRSVESLAEAAHSGNLELVKFLLARGASVSVESLNGAVLSGNLELVKYLVEKGCAVSGRPLATAAREGHLTIAQYLIDHGAEVTREAIYNARNGKYKELVDLLQAHASAEVLSDIRRERRRNWLRRLLYSPMFGGR